MVRSAAAVLALLLSLPALLPAQQAPSSRTHVVERGNTLWGLAQVFYGDAYRWPRIFEANRDRLDDPDLLEPGLVLRVPEESTGATGAANALPAGEPPGTVRGVTVAPAGERTGTVRGVVVDSGGSVAPGAAPVADPAAGSDASRGAAGTRTTFYPEPPPPVGTAADTRRVLAFSEDDFLQAHWLAPVDRPPEHLGTISGLGAPDDVRHSARPFDEVRLTMDGRAPAPGERLQTFRVERRVKGVGRIAVPTGTLVVTEHTPDGVVATVDDLFGRMARGDFVRPAPGFPLRPGMVSRPVDSSARAPVLAFARAQKVQGLGDYLFLGAGSAEGVRVGDVFETTGEGTPAVDDRPGGRVQVIAVHEAYSTARIIALENPVFETGVVLRLSRRMQ